MRTEAGAFRLIEPEERKPVRKVKPQRPNQRRRVRRPSPALIVACIALIVALGGTSYAAFSLPAGSVGTTQLRNLAVTQSKLADGVVGSAKLRTGAVTAAKLARGAVPSNAVAPGAGVQVFYKYGTVLVSPGTRLPAYVACPAGTTVVGGGMTSPSSNVVTNDSAPFNSKIGTWTGGPSDSWGVYVTNTDAAQPNTVGIYAICVIAGSIH